VSVTIHEATASRDTVQVAVWVCPTPGCGNWYGSSSAGDLARAENRAPNGGPVTSTRDECPDCKVRGKRVRRVRHMVAIQPGVVQS
jgi:hypothetical protein